MVHASMMRNFSVTEGPTEKVILGDAYIHDACMHDAYIYAPWSLCICQWCINVWCMCVWCIYPWCGSFVMEGRTDEPTVILTRVCMMHVFMMRHICHACTNLNSDAYIHYACIYYAYKYAPWSCMHDTYGSVSAGREKWPFNVLFFFKSRASVWPNLMR